jgi:GT2 family glycosyltransferase
LAAPVFVVVVNLNRWADTIECLESLLRSDYENTYIMVVDNGSTDGSMEILSDWARGSRPPDVPTSETMRPFSWPPLPKPIEHLALQRSSLETLRDREFPRVTFIATGTNLGFAGGNNVALEFLVDSQPLGYACLINNDMVVAPNAVRELVETIDRDATIGAVGGVILDYARPDMVQLIGGGRMSRLGMSEVCGAGLRRDEVREPRSLGYISGGLLLARLETLRRVGLLDERYFLYAEDADWGERMRKHGYRLACALDSRAWHKGTQTIVAKSPFQDYHVVRSALLYVRKHAPWFTPLAASYSVLRSFVPKIVRGQWVRARAVLRAYADYARGQ